MDQEALSRLFAEHDLLAIPVVDDLGRMKGIVTVDDIVDVVQEEATEDIQKYGGTRVIAEPQKPQGWEETGSVSRDIPGVGFSIEPGIYRTVVIAPGAGRDAPPEMDVTRPGALDGLTGAVPNGRSNYCTSCYTGVYPVAFPRDEKAYLQLALKVVE